LVRSPTSSGRLSGVSSTASIPARPLADDHLREGRDVAVGGAAAAAHEVEPAVVDEVAENAREVFRRLAVTAVFVGQAGVGDTGHTRPCQLGERAHVVAHQLRAGRAVEPDVEQVVVGERDDERLGVLASEHRPGELDGHRDGHRDAPSELGESVFDAEQPGLQVAGVLRGLEQQVVGAAGHQAEGLDAEVVAQALEGDAAGDRDRLRRRPHRAADEAQAAGRVVARAGLAGELGGALVELEGARGEVVFGEHQRRRAEGVGLHDVGAGVEVGGVEGEDRVGPGGDEDLVAALELRAAEVFGGQVEALEGGAGGAVHHQDALLESLQQRGGARLAVGGTGGEVGGRRRGVAHMEKTRSK
jgi:hypothetical protein